MAKGFQNSERYKIHNQYFEGGVSIDPKLAIADSFYQSQNLDFRSVPSQMGVLPGSRTIANNLTDTITAMTQDINGVRYGIGDNGGFYKINTSNVVSKLAQLGVNSKGYAGIYYNQVTDQIYIPGARNVSLYGQVTTGNPGNPVLRSGQFAKSASIANGTNQLWDSYTSSWSGGARNNAATTTNAQGIQVGITSIAQVTTNATQTYSVPTVLSESGLNYCFFSPDIEPFFSIAVYIKNKGTGNWTLTLHDSLNNELVSVTVANSSLTNDAYYEFIFGKQVRATVNASQTGNTGTYHFHLTSTVADGTVGTLNNADLTSADFLLFAYRLVDTNNGWHPTAYFGGTGFPLLCMGNGRYLATYNFGNDSQPNNAQFNRHTLQFSFGEEVCGLSTNGQYLVIATEKRSTNANRNYQEGALYFWDGTTTAPNFKIDIPMGSPYGLYTINNVTYFIIAGSLYAWSNGQTILKVRKLAYQNTDYLNAVDSTIVNPNMLTSRYNILMIGYPTTTTNVNIDYGVWSWGAVELSYPNSFGYSYSLANGILNNNTSGISNLKIGCVQNFVDTMYISWSYTDAGGQNRYGIDVVDNYSTPATTFSWKSLIYDGTAIYKTKVATRMKIKFNSFPAGYTLTPYYILDRKTPVYGTASPSVGDTDLVLDISNSRFKEIQWGFTGTSSGATVPLIITGVTMEIEPLREEVDLRRDDT